MGNWTAAAAGLATALLLTACGSGEAPAPSTSSSAAPVELTTEQYQAALTELETVVKPLAERTAEAKNLAELNAARAALGNALMKQQLKFRAITPPANARAQHRRWDQYFLGLSALSVPSTISDKPTECGNLVDEGLFVRNGKMGVLIDLRRDNMREFPAEFDKAGLKFHGLPLPPEPPEYPVRRAGNGEVVHRAGARGRGTLAVVNKGEQDVAVSAVYGEPANPAATVYVRAGGRATLSGLPAGRYGVYYKTGQDWDGGKRGFTRDCAFNKFLQGFEGNQAWEVTLSTGGGNAPVTKIPAF